MRLLVLVLSLTFFAYPVFANNFVEQEKNFSRTSISIVKSPKREQGESRGIFVYTHGMTSRHKHHQDNLLRTVYNAGYDVMAYDLPGHGNSERELFNIKGSVRSFEQLIQVLDEVILYAKESYGQDKDVYLAGWSLGGIITTVYLERNPYVAKAAVLFAPGVSLAIIHGDLSLVLGVDTEKLVHDEKKAKSLREDPGFFKYPPPSLAAALIAGYAEARFKKGEYQTPSLVMTAGEDHFAHSPGVKKFYEKASQSTGVQIEFRHFPESYHDLENDVDSQEVLQEVVEYLRRN